jgi:hypothetical protein
MRSIRLCEPALFLGLPNNGFGKSAGSVLLNRTAGPVLPTGRPASSNQPPVRGGPTAPYGALSRPLAPYRGPDSTGDATA